MAVVVGYGRRVLCRATSSAEFHDAGQIHTRLASNTIITANTKYCSDELLLEGVFSSITERFAFRLFFDIPFEVDPEPCF